MSDSGAMPRVYYLMGVGAFCVGIFVWLGTRMDGLTFLATTLYVVLTGIYLLMRWKFGPWSASHEQSKLDETQIRALTATHFAILGSVVAILGFLVIANEMSRWAPEFTERQITTERSVWSGGEKVLKASATSTERLEKQMAVVGVAKQTGDVFLVGLKPFLEDTSNSILKKITEVALTLLILPMIGIPALKLLEAFGGGGR